MMTSSAARYAAKAAVLAVTAALYFMTRSYEPMGAGTATPGQNLRFDMSVLEPAENGRPMREVRAVHPRLEHIDAWVSSVGAGIALADADGDGLPNDACLVDPRNDSVTLLPVPGSPARYVAFALPIPEAGYGAGTIAPMGCLLADLDEDGRTDVLVYYWGRTPVAFLRADDRPLSAAAFREVELVPRRERWFTNAAVLTDVDGDGHPDLLVGNYYRDGDRVLDPAATDEVATQHSMSRAFNGGLKHLLLWQPAPRGSVSYADASDSLRMALPAGEENGWTLAIGARDLDADLLPEIYIVNDFGPDRLLHNCSEPSRPCFTLTEGSRGLATPRSKVLGRDSFKGMGVDFGDVNGDGRPDIAVSNIARPYGLIESHFLFVNTGEDKAYDEGRAPFVDQSGWRGTWISDWAWDLKFADLDNNGRPELVQAVGFVQGTVNRWPELQELATGNDELLQYPLVWPRFSRGDDLSGQGHDHLFVMDESGRYHDASARAGLMGPSVSRGIAVADVDGDGLLDMVIARQWMPSVFLRNTSVAAGQFLTLDLRLAADGGSRPAIGARATITLPDGRRLAEEVDGGSGHSGKRAPEIHFGLGNVPADAPLAVALAWRDPGGLRERHLELLPGRHRILLEAESAKVAAVGVDKPRGLKP